MRALGPPYLLIYHIYCTTHFAFYIKDTYVYSIDWEIQYNIPVFLTWYQSYCSDIFLAVLSLLVSLHSQHCFRRHNSRRSLSLLNLQRLPAVVLEFWTCIRCRWGVLHCTDYYMCRHRRLYCSDCIYRGITKIVFSRSTRRWKSRSHRSLHAPPKDSMSAPHALHSLTNFFTRRLHSSRASTRQIWTSWRQP